MKISFTVRKLWYTLGALMFVASHAVSALGQCAMCKATLQSSASANPQAVADVFNLAVLVLLIPPVLLFSGFFVVLMRYRRGVDEGASNPLNQA